MAANMIKREVPSVRLPQSSETCDISVINTTTNIVAPPHYLVEPSIMGHNWLNLPTYSYLIKHVKSGKQLLFDLGCRKDWDNLVPRIANTPANAMPGLSVEKDIVDVLAEGNVKPTDIDTVILSHWHFDHSGDLALFPKDVDVVVGPEFTASFLPGYPKNKESPFHEAEFDTRNVIEISFQDDFTIGQFPAHDFFGDGSLYLLDVPGHAIGHIAAIVRTTPDTAIFLGGDVCHFTGMLRPNKYDPMPETVPEETALDPAILKGSQSSIFTAIHPEPQNSSTTPFYKPSTHKSSFYADAAISQISIDRLQEFDADPNFLTLIAHDPTPLGVLPFFPHGMITDWKAKGYKQALHWGFVSELPYNGKTVRSPLTDGVYKYGKRLKTLMETVF